MSKNKWGEYKGLQLLESQIRYAMANSCSNAEAAKWLHVCFSSWKKYAKMYKDEASGKNLYDLHRDTGAAQRLILPKTKYKRKSDNPNQFQAFLMEDVFANKHLTYAHRTFGHRLINEGWKEERCACCGFQERRKYDYAVPLKMHWIDGNKSNYALENIQFLCFNCYFINVGNFFGAEKKFMMDEATGEPVPVMDVTKQKKNAVVFGPYYNPSPRRKKEN